MKYVLILGLITLVAVAAGRHICDGCPDNREGAELEASVETLKNSLSKLADEDGPDYKRPKIRAAFNNFGTDVLLLTKVGQHYKNVKPKDAYDAEIVGVVEIKSVDIEDKLCKYCPLPID